MSMHFRELTEQAVADGAISAEEILTLRRAGWSDGRFNPEEAEALFVINHRLSHASPEWTDFFVEALGEFIVNGVPPKGHVAPEQGDWLIAQIDHDGRIDSMAELELLAKVFEKAASVPAALREFALRAIEQAVLTGEGPTRCGGTLQAGAISEAEVRLLRRFVFASGGERPAGVSRSEAELLFRLKDETLGKVNAPGWKQLFVQGVGNYLSGFAGAGPISRERAAELEAFMNDTRSSIGGFFGRMGRSAIGADFLTAFEKRQARDHAAEVLAERAITETEDTWLQGRMDANDRIDEFDQALLDFIAEENRR